MSELIWNGRLLFVNKEEGSEYECMMIGLKNS